MKLLIGIKRCEMYYESASKDAVTVLWESFIAPESGSNRASSKHVN